MKGMKYVEAPVRTAQTFIDDDAWVMSQKLDGTRVMAHIMRHGEDPEQDTVHFLGANGTPVKFAAAAQYFKRLKADLLGSDLPTSVIDGELMLNGAYHAFDLPYMRGEVLPEDPFKKRWERLSRSGLSLAPIAFERDQKQILWERINEQNAEGAIVRPVGSAYEIGRRSGDVRKLKIVKTVDVVVKKFSRGRNAAGREVGSATLAVYDEAGNLKTVGGCSLIGKAEVEVGDVIEVRFLYATSSLVLYQPRMMRRREDKEPAECTLDQVRQWVTSREIITV